MFLERKIQSFITQVAARCRQCVVCTTVRGRKRVQRPFVNNTTIQTRKNKKKKKKWCHQFAHQMGGGDQGVSSAYLVYIPRLFLFKLKNSTTRLQCIGVRLLLAFIYRHYRIRHLLIDLLCRTAAAGIQKNDHWFVKKVNILLLLLGYCVHKWME